MPLGLPSACVTYLLCTMQIDGIRQRGGALRASAEEKQNCLMATLKKVEAFTVSAEQLSDKLKTAENTLQAISPVGRDVAAIMKDLEDLKVSSPWIINSCFNHEKLISLEIKGLTSNTLSQT